MLRGLFSPDGRLAAACGKIVDLVLATLLWIVGSLPVVTLLPAAAGLYHSVVKCIRYDRGSVFADFKEAYRNGLRQGTALTLLYGAVGAAIAWGDYAVLRRAAARPGAMLMPAAGLVLLSAVYVLNVLWLVPVFSRFSNTLGGIVRLSYVLALRNLLRSIPMLLILGAAVLWFLASNEAILFLPALAALGCSYLAEPALRRYMPKREREDGDWRYGAL